MTPDPWRAQRPPIRLRVHAGSCFSKLLMTDEPPDLDKVRVRRQPPVPLTLAVFLAAVAGFIVVVTGLFALLRYLDGR